MVSHAQKQVFISYAREDGKPYAKRLQSELETVGFKTWLDERNLDPYQDFSGAIEGAIQNSDYVVVCVTRDVSFRENSFVRREMQYAMLWSEEAEDGHPKIIPLVFPDGYPPPILVVNLTYIPCFVGKKQDRRLDFEIGLRGLWSRLGISSPEEPLSRQSEGDSIVPTRMPSIKPFVQVEPFAEANEEEVSLPISPPPEPYKDHLWALYKSIVEYLNQTVFSLITLSSKATPEAVNQRSVLPMRFADANSEHVFNNIQEAFQGYRGSLLLLGDPGAGKTTTLLAFAREMVAQRLEDSSLPLPIYLRISEWSRETQPKLDEWIASKTTLALENVEQLRKSGQLLLLLDGLDELGDNFEIAEKNLITRRKRVLDSFDPRLRFMQMVERDLGNNAIVITSRVKDYQAIGTKISLRGAVTLRALDDEQLAQYLDDQTDLLNALQTDQGLREMAGNPLLLSLLRFAYSEMNADERQLLHDLTHSPLELRDKVFEIYVRRRFEHEEKRKNVPLRFNLEQSYALLGELAVQITGEINSSKREVYASLKRSDKNLSHGQISQFLEQMRRLHILIIDDNSPRFIHLLLRDYFAFHRLQIMFNINDTTTVKALETLRDDRLNPKIESVIKSFVLGSGDYTKSDEFILSLQTMHLSGDTKRLIALVTHIYRGKNKKIYLLDTYQGCVIRPLALLLLITICFYGCMIVGNLLTSLSGQAVSRETDAGGLIGAVLATIILGYYIVFVDLSTFRGMSIKALENIDDPEAIALLKRARWDINWEVRREARRALKKHAQRQKALQAASPISPPS